MKKKKLVGILLIAMFMVTLGASKVKVSSKDVLTEIKKIEKDAVAIEQSLYSNKASEIYNDSGEVIGRYIFTNKAKGEKGYVPVVVVLDKNDKIEGIGLLPSKEPKSLLKKIRESNFLEKWNGVSIKKAKSLKVDAVAGATKTSKAIVKEVKYSSKK